MARVDPRSEYQYHIPWDEDADFPTPGLTPGSSISNLHNSSTAHLVAESEVSLVTHHENGAEAEHDQEIGRAEQDEDVEAQFHQVTPESGLEVVQQDTSIEHGLLKRISSRFFKNKGKRFLCAVIVLWLFFIAQLVSYCLFRPRLYGLHTIDSGSLTSRGQMYMIGYNALAIVIIYASDVVRQHLLAPTAAEVTLDPPVWTVGYSSLRNFWRVRWWRKILYVVLIITSVPLNLLFNSMVLEVQSSYDSYEVLMSDNFLNGAPFDVSTLNATHFPDQIGSPIPYNAKFPQDWPALDALQAKLEALQKNTSTWYRFDQYNCRALALQTSHTSFRTLVWFTSWNHTVPSTNAALAIAAAPGQTITTGYGGRYVAMCPATWLGMTPGSLIPETSPFMEFGGVDADGCFQDGSLKMSCYNNPYIGSASDLCYDYRTFVRTNTPELAFQDGWNPDNAVLVDYCLTEPLSDSDRRVMVTVIAFIILLVLGAKALTATIVYGIVESKPIMTREDAPDGNFIEPSKWPLIICHCLVNLGILVTVIQLLLHGTTKLGNYVEPTSTSDHTWIVPMLLWQNFIHALITIRLAIENNFCDSRYAFSHWIMPVLMGLNYVFWHQVILNEFSVLVIESYGIHSLAGSTDFTPIAFLENEQHSPTSSAASWSSDTDWQSWAFIVVAWLGFVLSAVVPWGIGFLLSRYAFPQLNKHATKAWNSVKKKLKAVRESCKDSLQNFAHWIWSSFKQLFRWCCSCLGRSAQEAMAAESSEMRSLQADIRD